MVKGTTTLSPPHDSGVSGPDLFNDSHRFVTEDITRLHCRHVSVVMMKIGPAAVCACDANDGIGRLKDRWFRHGFQSNICLAVPNECSQHVSLGGGCRRQATSAP